MPLDANVPDAIFSYLSDRLKSKECYQQLKCSLIVQDLNNDSVPEYTFINGAGRYRDKAFMLAIQDADKIQEAKIQRYRVNFGFNMSDLCCLHYEWDSGVKVEAKTPTWLDLSIGGKRFMVDSNSERTP